MAKIRVIKSWRSHGVMWRSGHFYTFRYNAYRTDPFPVIILMYKIQGINPPTGHQFNLIQGINLNYIPRIQRQIFVDLWASEMNKSGGNAEFTWNTVQKRFPYLELAVRRYMIKPSYRIQNPQQIPFDKLEEVVISTWSRDFSNKLKFDLNSKMARASARGEEVKQKFTSKWSRLGKSFFSFARDLFKKR